MKASTFADTDLSKRQAMEKNTRFHDVRPPHEDERVTAMDRAHAPVWCARPMTRLTTTLDMIAQTVQVFPVARTARSAQSQGNGQFEPTVTEGATQRHRADPFETPPNRT